MVDSRGGRHIRRGRGGANDSVHLGGWDRRDNSGIGAKVGPHLLLLGGDRGPRHEDGEGSRRLVAADRERNDPATLTPAVDPAGIDARPRCQESKHRRGVDCVDLEVAVTRRFARIGAGGSPVAPLVVRQHRQAEAGVETDPDAVIDPRSRSGSMNDDDARARRGREWFGDRCRQDGAIRWHPDLGLLEEKASGNHGRS